MTRAYVGLGANLGDPMRTLRSALRALSRLPATRCLAHAPFYRNPPMGPQDQPDYVNTVALLETTLPPLRLLARLQRIEARHGRLRDGTRWGPRLLDLDLLVYGPRPLRLPGLRLPHPGTHRRAFVLYPLADLTPNLVIPGRGALRHWLPRRSPLALRRIPGRRNA